MKQILTLLLLLTALNASAQSILKRFAQPPQEARPLVIWQWMNGMVTSEAITSDLKPVADKAFCGGVNAVMLHACAVNPWPAVSPGMAFGKWGTPSGLTGRVRLIMN